MRQAIYQDARVARSSDGRRRGRVGRVAISPTLAERLAAGTRSVVEEGADAAGLGLARRDGGPMSPSSISHLVAKGRAPALAWWMPRAATSPTRTAAALGRLASRCRRECLSHGCLSPSSGTPGRPSPRQRYSHLLGDAELDRFAAAHSDRNPPGDIAGGGRLVLEKRMGSAISDS